MTNDSPEEEDYTEEIEEAEEEIGSLLREGINIDQVVELADIRERLEDENAT